jgi:C1A family cysteine protease
MSSLLSSPNSARFSTQKLRFLVGGGVLMLTILGGSAAFWLTQNSQDLRQQAAGQNPLYVESLAAAQTVSKIKSQAAQKGLSVSESEAQAIAQKVQNITLGQQTESFSGASAQSPSTPGTTATWEAGLTSIALERLRNPGYSPLSSVDDVMAGFTQKVESGDIPPLPSPTQKPSTLTALLLGDQLSPNSGLPTSYDWRSAHGANFMTSVKDQGACGACWAFSGNAGFESAIAAYFNAPGKQLDLSEQNLLSCSANTAGCIGTKELLQDYYAYISAKGVVTEACMAYQRCDQTIASCSCPTGARCSGVAGSQIYQASYGTVPVVWADRNNAILDTYQTTQNMKRAIIEHGPIVTGLYLYSDFDFYVNGIYQRSASSTFKGGHAVAVVGWGEENGQGYWIIKNSWSPAWGIAGYGKYKMMGATPGSRLDLLAISNSYRLTGGADFGIEGVAAVFAYNEKPLLAYITTPTMQGDSVPRSCTDRDQDSYCYWGFGTTKPSNCPASCANHTEPDCDDGRNNLGANCTLPILPSATPIPTLTPIPTATRAPTIIPTATKTPTPTPTLRPGTTAAPSPTQAPTATLAPTSTQKAGDLNQDSVVNLADVTILRSVYGEPASALPRADLNADGRINAVDYALLLDLLNK